MTHQVLIVTNSQDVHTDTLEPLLRQKGCTPFRVNMDEFPRRYRLDLRCRGGEVSAILEQTDTGQRLDTGDIGAIWMRKAGTFSFADPSLAEQERKYAEQETEHVLFSLLYTQDCYWMSHPLAVRGSLWKGKQLQVASELGFRVPETLISNSPEAVREFKGGLDGDMIFKPLSSAFLAADKVADDDRLVEGMTTTLIGDEHMQDLEAVRNVPCCFQGYVPKQYELRVTVIGNSVFAARIHSQLDERTKIDFRDYAAEIPYEATALPPEIEERCRALVHHFGLTYGALDIIVTPEGDYVFLEVNPVGQFMFVEQLVPDLRMMDAMATCLATGASC